MAGDVTSTKASAIQRSCSVAVSDPRPNNPLTKILVSSTARNLAPRFGWGLLAATAHRLYRLVHKVVDFLVGITFCPLSQLSYNAAHRLGPDTMLTWRVLFLLGLQPYIFYEVEHLLLQGWWERLHMRL